MAKKYTFPEAGCCGCPHLQRIGSGLCENRCCNGFPKRKNPRRFRPSDPKYKAPKWCPRRISPPVCRIYGFADKCGESMDFLRRHHMDAQGEACVSPLPWHYKLRLELPLGMKTAQFFEETRYRGVDDVLPDAGLQPGEVIEVDDGLKPYFFYYLNWSAVVPIACFDRSKVQTPEGE